jgi:hypothetical protein
MDPQASQTLASWVTAGASVVTALVASVYMVTTIGLWRTTKKSVETLGDAFKLSFLLAYKEAGGGFTVGRLKMLFGERDSMGVMAYSQAQCIDRLLKSVYPELYAEIKAAVDPPPQPPSSTKPPTAPPG